MLPVPPVAAVHDLPHPGEQLGGIQRGDDKVIRIEGRVILAHGGSLHHQQRGQLQPAHLLDDRLGADAHRRQIQQHHVQVGDLGRVFQFHDVAAGLAEQAGKVNLLDQGQHPFPGAREQKYVVQPGTFAIQNRQKREPAASN